MVEKQFLYHIQCIFHELQFFIHIIMKRFRNICLWGMQDINFLGVIQFRASEEKRRKRVFKKNSPSIYKKKTWRNRSLFTIREIERVSKQQFG